MTIKISIIDLENTARARKDHTSNIHIRKGHYLIVKYNPDADPEFTYHWGYVKLARNGAALLMSEVDKYVP